MESPAVVVVFAVAFDENDARSCTPALITPHYLRANWEPCMPQFYPHGTLFRT